MQKRLHAHAEGFNNLSPATIFNQYMYCTSGYNECITLLKENGSAALNKPWRGKRITFDKRLRAKLDICFCMSLLPINVKLGHVLVSHFLHLKCNGLYTSAGAQQMNTNISQNWFKPFHRQMSFVS